MLKKLKPAFNNSASSARRWPKLLLLGALSLLIYWIGLIRPYSLFAIKLRPQLDIVKLTMHNPLAQAEFVLVLVSQAGLYFLAWRVCRPAGGRSPRAMWLVLGISLALIACSMIWLYPIGAVDVFEYIIRGRITAIYGGNPFAVIPRAFPYDIFRPYVGWVDSTSTYGPIWELLAAGMSRLAGNSPLANVLVYKFLDLVFYGLSSALIALILNRAAPQRALQGVVLFAWNPLILYETLGNAHNDIVMVFFILLGVYAFLRGHSSWTMLALTAGALVKIIPFMLLPLAWIAGLRLLRSWQQRVRFTLTIGAACAGLILVTAAPFLNSWGSLKLIPTLTDLFTTSLPAFVQAQLQPRIGVHSSQLIVAYAAYAILGVVILIQMRRIWVALRSGTEPAQAMQQSQAGMQTVWLALVKAATATLLFYLIFTCDWFQAWYAIWPLGLAALLPEGPIIWTALLLSYVSLWKTPIFNFFLFTSNISLPPATWRETLLGPVTLGLVWLYLAARAIFDWAASRRSIRRPSPGFRPQG